MIFINSEVDHSQKHNLRPIDGAIFYSFIASYGHVKSVNGLARWDGGYFVLVLFCQEIGDPAFHIVDLIDQRAIYDRPDVCG